MFFQITVNLIHTFPYVNLMYVFICIFVVKHIKYYTFFYVAISSAFVYDPIYVSLRASL